MSKLFLHVGMPKTGTSFIQGFVNLNKNKIKEIVDMDFISALRPHEIACHLITNQVLNERVDIKSLRTSDFVEIERELSEIKNGGLDCFCSSEYFVLCDKNDVNKFFLKFFNEIEIIYTVRRQDKLLASGFNQDVKALNRTSNLVWSYKNEKTMRYFQNCKEWEALGCVIKVIDYDAVKKEKNGLNKAIFSLFLDADALFSKDFRKPSADASNYSLSEDEVILKLCLNRMEYDGEELLSEFNLFNSTRREFNLPPAYERLIASSYYDDNQALIAEYIDATSTSDLSFQDVTLNKNINIEEAKFAWDPLAKNKNIIEFFLSKWCKKE